MNALERATGGPPLRRLALALAMVAPFGCGGNKAAAGSANVGPAGGSVTLSQGPAKGTAVSVPPGALSSTVVLTITAGAAPTDLPVGTAASGPSVVLGPEGQAFGLAVTVTIPVSGAATGMLSRPVSGGTWSAVPGATYDSVRSVVVALTSHFSIFVPVQESALPDGGSTEDDGGGSPPADGGDGGMDGGAEDAGDGGDGGTDGGDGGPDAGCAEPLVDGGCPAPAVSISALSLTVYLPANLQESFTIRNTGSPGTNLDFVVADDGALGGHLNVGNQIGGVPAGESVTIDVNVKPEFVSSVPSLIGATLVLNVYTPGASNYTKTPVSVRIRGRRSFASDDQFTLPTGLVENSITVEAWGGGGRGGSSIPWGYTCGWFQPEGGGGGGGGYGKHSFTGVPETTYPVRVGRGGSYYDGGCYRGSIGGPSNGGDSSFGDPPLIIAYGGAGGGGCGNNTAGGAGGGTSAGLTLTIPGEAGADGSGGSGGKGGSGGDGGQGGQGGRPACPGHNGDTPGGGGGGSGVELPDGGGGMWGGGCGGSGQVIVTWGD